MHVEQNVCENIMRTICGEKDKEVRWDMVLQNICPHLYMAYLKPTKSNIMDDATCQLCAK
jgi:hypothetical protein